MAHEEAGRAAGLLHRLMKPRAVWCPRDAAQGEATSPRGAADLAGKSWARICRTHAKELQEADRPWEILGPRGNVGIAAAHRGRTRRFHRSRWLVQAQDGYRNRCDTSIDVVPLLTTVH